MSAVSPTAVLPAVAGTRLASNNEWSLLLAGCADDIQPQQTERLRALCGSVRWKIVFDLADRHGVQPLLHQALSRIEDAVPAAEMRVLKQLYQTNLHKALFLSRELIRILDHLGESGIEVIPYKGVALAESVYGDMALRKAGDIDLLIHAYDLARVREAVASLGYKPQTAFSPAQERAYMKTGYECAFDGAAGRNLLEVQWAIQPRFYAVDFDLEGVFQRARAASVAGHLMKTPSPEDLFIILALHAAKHVWGRLIWLCDLARIMRMDSLNWAWIGAQAKELGIARILRVTLLLANNLLNVAVPGAAEANLPADSESAALAAQLEGYITHDRAYDVESFSYFRLMLRLRENPADRIRFLRRLIFTPGPGEWKAVRLPPALFPLYWAVRLFRLAGRIVRA